MAINMASDRRLIAILVESVNSGSSSLTENWNGSGGCQRRSEGRRTRRRVICRNRSVTKKAIDRVGSAWF